MNPTIASVMMAGTMLTIRSTIDGISAVIPEISGETVALMSIAALAGAARAASIITNAQAKVIPMTRADRTRCVPDTTWAFAVSCLTFMSARRF